MPRWLRALLVTLGGLAAGLVGAFAFTLTQQHIYRAETSMLAQVGSQPVTGGLLDTIRGLVTTDIVAQNVITNAGLDETSTQFFNRLHVRTSGSDVIVDVDDPSQEQAIKIAQELSLVFTQLVRDRFGATANAAAVSIFDPAHAVGQVSPDLRRDLGWGALFGALLGLLVANVFILRGRRGVWVPAPYPLYYPELEQPRRALPAPPTVATVDADTLLEQAEIAPFQTVLLAGDADGAIAARLAERLNERGETATWTRDVDADSDELDRLAALFAYVLVSAPSFDVDVARAFDAVVVIGDGPVGAIPGVRILGTAAP